MKLDLHMHCCERSACGISTEIEQIESALSIGLDGIAFTDHDKLAPKNRLKELNEQYAPFKIFKGIEIRTKDAGEDVLVIGLDHADLENREWYYEPLHAFVRQHRGFIILAHPYRFASKVTADVARFTPDAVEIHSMNIGRCDETLIQALADRTGVKTIACSDSHFKGNVGVYHIDLREHVNTDADLVEALGTGDYVIMSDPRRIAEHNDRVRKVEDEIRRMIQQGKTAEDYRREIGGWDGPYHRVAMGKSYEI